VWFRRSPVLWWLAYSVDECGSVPIIVERTFSCSIRSFWVVTPSIEFRAYRWSFKRENIRRKLKLTVHLHQCRHRDCVAVYRYCTVIIYHIYFIVALNQTSMHKFQAVILEYSPSVTTVTSPLKPRGNFKKQIFLNLKSIKFNQAHLCVSYDSQNKEKIFSYITTEGFLFQHR